MAAEDSRSRSLSLGEVASGGVATRSRAGTAGWLVVGLGAAVVLRAIVSGRSGAVSMPAATVFALVVAALALGGGWRPGRPRLVSMVVGAVAGAVLVVGPVV